MRRLLVIPVLIVAAVWPAHAVLAEGVTRGSGAAAPSVRADFNNDGAADLAVGAPNETVGSVASAGAVNVTYGSGGGLTGAGSQLFTQDSPGIGSSVEIDDLFGRELVAGDVDGDGFVDLVVGAPGEDVGTVQSAGAVVVIYGSSRGLTGAGSQLFTQDTAGVGSSVEARDSFGGALAAGDVDGDGVDDVAVGAPNETVGSVAGAGAVNVLFGSAAGVTGAGSQLFTQDVAGVGSSVEADDNFGGALAVGDVDDDGTADLAVGVPQETVGSVRFAGALNVLFGSAAGLTGAGSQLFTQDTAGVGSTAEAFDFFGLALATGDFDANGPDDLAVGVPGEDVGAVDTAGAVNVLDGSAGGLTGSGSQLFTQDTAGVGSTAESLDRFGEALAAGDLDGDAVADLAVGAPTESVGAVEAAGALNILYGSATGLTGSGSQLFTQDTAGIGSTAEETDLFGVAVAAGDFDGDGVTDLGVGVSQESVGAVQVAGAVNVLYGSGAGLAGSGSQLFTQDTAGIGSTAEAFDLFGAALAAAPSG